METSRKSNIRSSFLLHISKNVSSRTSLFTTCSIIYLDKSNNKTNRSIKILPRIFNIKRLLLLAAVTALMVFFSNYSVIKSAQNKTFSDASDIPKNRVGLVLGTSMLLKNGNLNLYFKYRIAATVELYKKNKIEFVLVSGDNGNKQYDEPTDFKDELIRKGIPAEKIFLDYAGFRTLDSVVRAKKIFGQSSITFISQKFHNERAIYLASKNGIDAIGYNATDVAKRYGLKVKIREYFARTKASLDVLFGVDPKFLGAEIEIK